MDLTLNAFRAVLGRVNDGDVVFKNDGQGQVVGLRKVNYGWNCKEATVPDPEENRKVREAFLQAVSNSPEARRAGDAYISALRTQLLGEAEGSPLATQALARRTVLQVLQELDGAATSNMPDNRKSMTEAFVLMTETDLHDAGIYDRRVAKLVRVMLRGEGEGTLACFRSRQSMCDTMSAFFSQERTFNGFTKAEMFKFIDNNASRIEMLAYEHLYLSAYEELSNDSDAKKDRQAALPDRVVDSLKRSDGGQTLLLAIIDGIMAEYGRGHEPSTRISHYVKAPRTVEPKALPDESSRANLTKLQDVVKMLFPLAEGAGQNDHFLERHQEDGQQQEVQVLPVFDLLDQHQQNALMRPVFNFLTSAFAEAASEQNADDARERIANTLSTFGSHCEAGARLLAAHEVIAALDDGDRKVFAEIFLQRLQSALAGVNLQGEDGNRILVENIAAVVDGMLMTDRTKAQFEAVFREALKAGNIDLHENEFQRQADAFWSNKMSGQVAADWACVRCDSIMRTLRPGFSDGRQDVSEKVRRLHAAIVASVSESLGDKGVREAMLKKIGDTKWGGKFLPQDMCNPDGKPKDENLILAGKVVFLELVLSENALHEAGILDDNWKFASGNEKEASARVDELMARFSQEQIARSVDYFVNNIVWNDSTHVIYNLANDGVFGDEKLTCRSSQVLGVAWSSFALSGAISNQAINVCEGSAQDKKCFADVVLALAKAFDLEVRELPFPDGEANVKEVFQFCNGCMLALANDTEVFGDDNSKMTWSAKEVAGLISSCKLTLRDLETPLGLSRLLLAFVAVACHGGNTVGAVAWLQRTTGFDLRTISPADMPELAAKMGALKAGNLPDPLEDDRKFPAGMVHLLDGRAKMSESGLSKDEMAGLLGALDDLVGVTGKETVSRDFKLAGLKCQLKALDDGKLEAIVTANKRTYLIAVPRSAEDFRALIETEVATNPDDERYVALVTSVLPRLDEEGLPVGMSVSRARELCVKILVAKLGCSSVSFATFGLPELVNAAVGAVNGSFTVDNLPKEPSRQYNASDVAAVQLAYASASDEDVGKVKLPPRGIVPSADERRANEPSDQTVHDLVAELFLNLDTSVFDQDAETPGLRLRKVRLAYGPELSHFKSPEDVTGRLGTFPAIVRQELAALLDAFIELSPEATDEAFAAFEAKVETTLNGLMQKLQRDLVNPLFESIDGGDVRDERTWTLPLEELTGVDGLDEKTPKGKFVRAVLTNYFEKAWPTEKRAMLATYLRNVFVRPAEGGQGAVEPSRGVQAGELMKGGGPVFQKILQGLPIESFDLETRKALQDMKSSLLPIPEPVVKAMLLDLVKSSNGNVLSVEVIRTIGCATVGQAVLCHVKTKEHPYSGEDVVIKLLRPNVQTAALREFEVISQLALETGGEAMVAMFKAQFDSILEEMDFTREAENVDVAFVQYDRPASPDDTDMSSVRCLRRIASIPATPGVLVLEKVEGDTLDRELRDARAKYERIVSRLKGPRGDGNEIRMVWEGNSIDSAAQVRSALDKLVQQLIQKRQKLESVVKNWVDTALFKTGFMHCDLHPGNLMEGGKNITYIDFGNVQKLSQEEKNGIAGLFVSVGYCDRNLHGEAKFLATLESMLDAAGKDALKGVRGELEADIADVLAKGRGDKVVARLIVSLALVQRKGIALPPGLGGFMQSLSRLQSAVGEIDRLIEDCDAGILKAHVASGVAAEFIGKFEKLGGTFPQIPQLMDCLKNLGKAYDYGVPQKYGREALRLKFIEWKGAQEKIEGEETVFATFKEVNPFFNGLKRVENDLSDFVALANLVKPIRYAFGDGLQEINSLGDFEEAIGKLQGLLDQPAANRSEAWEAEVKKAKRVLLMKSLDVLKDVFVELSFGYEYRPPRMSFEQMVGSCVEANSQKLIAQNGKDTSLLYFVRGSLFIDAHHVKAEEKAARMADAFNEGLPEGERIGVSRTQQLVAAARDFQLPDGSLSSQPIKREHLEIVLRCNFKTLRKRLGLKPGETLAPAEIRYLAAYFKNRAKVVDTATFISPKTILAINDARKGKSPVQAYSANHEGAHPLVEAVRALDEDGLQAINASCADDPEIRTFIEALRQEDEVPAAS